MKHYLLLFAAILFFVGCQKEEMPQDGIFINGELVGEFKDTAILESGVLENELSYCTVLPGNITAVIYKSKRNSATYLSEIDFFKGITIRNLPSVGNITTIEEGTAGFEDAIPVASCTVNKCSFGVFDWIDYNDKPSIDIHLLLSNGQKVDIRFNGNITHYNEITD